MKIEKTTLLKAFFLIFLIGISQGNALLQFVFIGIFGLFGILFINPTHFFYPFKNVFYWSLIIISIIPIGFFLRDDFSFNYVLNGIIITIMWILMLLCSSVLIRCIKSLNFEDVCKVVKWFFYINFIIIIIQYIGVSIKYKSIIPFIEHMGSGDYLKGIFTNSSVNMIVSSFYLVFFIYLKDRKNALTALIVMLLTTYMSGIFLFLCTTSLFAFLYLSFKTKIRVIFAVIIGVYAFSVLSPNNVVYVKNNLTKKLFSDRDPARKIVSFEQTFNFTTSSTTNFIFGAGGGKFSSRTAFMTSGDYVSWFPQSRVYSSEAFLNNHFTLWNSKLLSKPYKDGTANQPFSTYNKILGEYGFFGLLLLIVFYLYYPIKNYSKLTYGKLIFLAMLSYFILDYWFEYFTVIVFFELFIYLNINSLKVNEIHEHQ